jgi:UV excision repair protein RAD23
MDMGFPEPEVRACLRAAMGNSNVAVEYLMGGIPPQAMRMAAAAAGGATAVPTPSAAAGGSGAARGPSLDDLRRHPQFNMMKRLVQQNPAALSQILESIGQQSPELLAAIHADQPAFLAMMNEPISEEPAAPAAPVAAPGMGSGGMPSTADVLQMLMALPESSRTQAAAAMGMSPEQLQGLMQVLGSLPPEQLQQMLSSMDAGAAGGAGGRRGGQNVVRLTQEEMDAVTRLTELGFDQQDAAMAYLACDKNEALAANLLMDGWTSGGGGGAMDVDGGDFGDEGDDDEDHDHADDDMYT